MKRAAGAALLLLLVVLLLLAGGALVARVPADPQLQERADTRWQLQQAKEALLAYAVTYEDNYPNPKTAWYPPPGLLPCPNLNLPTTDESPNPPCHKYVPILGRLPRGFAMGAAGKVFESLPAGKRSGEEFWYVISRGFQNNYAPDVLNATTPALLSVDGQNGVVAVILAPGFPLAGQRRPSTDARDYLEGENADGDDAFAGSAAAANDQLVFITQQEFATRITARVAADLKKALDRAFDLSGSYPPALPADLPSWFAAHWATVTSYGTAGGTATLRFTGCAITYTLTRTATAPARSRATCG